MVDDSEPLLTFDGFAPWLPLPLDGDVEGFVAMVDEHFVDDPAPQAFLRAAAETLAGVGRQVAEQADDGYLPIAAWVLLADRGRRLEPPTLLTFGAHRVEPGSTANDFIEQMCAEIDLYQPPSVQDLDTASGPAALVRLRRYTGEDTAIELSEIVSVLWMADTMDLAYVMSTTPIEDLVLAADVADAVVPLARSVSGLRQSL